MKIGVLGTGQLALMMAQANKGMGTEIIPYGDKGCKTLSTHCSPVFAGLHDHQALKAFLHAVDIITYDSENIDVSKIEAIGCTDKLVPSVEALKIFQNRFYEKNFFVSEGLQTTRYMPIFEEESLESVPAYIGFPAVLKTATNGYDGRGQCVVNSVDELKKAWNRFNGSCLVEEFVDFDQEVSIIAARDKNRNIAFYPLTENFHRNGQLRLSIMNGHHPLQGIAENMIRKVMNKLDYIGCIAMEFFVKEGALIVNEVAPRVHNSGHWTIDGAEFSQFTQHLKAISGKFVFKPNVSVPVAMINCIGSLPDFSRYEGSDVVKCYDYGKEPRAERKLGHVNVLGHGQTDTEFYALVADLLNDFGDEALAATIFDRIRSDVA